jgi:hypothetical protein
MLQEYDWFDAGNLNKAAAAPFSRDRTPCRLLAEPCTGSLMAGALLDRSTSSLVPPGRRGLNFAMILVRLRVQTHDKYDHLVTR